MTLRSLCQNPRRTMVAAVTVLAALFPVLARAADISLTFGSLPSAQGWTFTSGGSPIATEAQAFSLGGSVLTLDTMTFGYTGVGTSAFYSQLGVVNNYEPVTIWMRGRVVQYEGDFTNAYVGGGFCFGFTQGATLFQMGITPTQIRNAAGTVLSTAYDNTQFHDYRLEWAPPSTVRYYVDGNLISTNNAGLAQALSRIHLGDGTGAANSRAEIVQYRFLQGQVVPVAGASWGRIKSLYR